MGRVRVVLCYPVPSYDYECVTLDTDGRLTFPSPCRTFVGRSFCSSLGLSLDRSLDRCVVWAGRLVFCCVPRTLRGHRHDVPKAAAMMRGMLKWRKENGVDAIREDIMQNQKFHPR